MKKILSSVLFFSFITFLQTPLVFSANQDYISEGNELVKEKKIKEAIDLYQKAIQEDPENVKAKTLLGLAYAQVGDFENAIKYAKQITDKEPESYTAFYNLGLIYGAHHDFEEAIQAFDRALSLNSDSFMAIYQKGLLYSASGDSEKAVESFQNALRMNPYLDSARIALVGTYIKMNDQVSAAKQIEEFRKMNKNDFANALEERMKNR